MTGLNGPVSMKKLVPASNRAANMGGSGGADMAVDCSVALARVVIAEGTRGMGWRAADAVEGGTGGWSQRLAVDQKTYRGGRLTSGRNAEPDNGAEVVVGAGVGMGAGSSSALLGSTGELNF